MTNQLPLDLTGASARERSDVVQVLSIIRRHVGRDNPLPLSAIAAGTNIDTRGIQEIVKFLTEERSIPIGTAWSEPFGYYIIRADRELATNYHQFLRRGLSNIKHANAYRRPSIVGPIAGQLEIEPIILALANEVNGVSRFLEGLKGQKR